MKKTVSDMAKDRRYTFLTKPETEGGFSSLIFAVIAAVLTAADIVISAIYGGNAGSTAGIIGLGAFLFAISGFFLGLYGLRKRNVSHKKAYIGMITGGLVMIIWLALMISALK